MKKTILTLLGLLLLAAPMAVQAQYYCNTNADNTLTIIGYSGPGGDVTIPTNINPDFPYSLHKTMLLT